MNREDIIRMAREAGFTPQRDEWLFTEMLERFATLVAAAEREACAKVCDDGLKIATSLQALDDMEIWGEKFAKAIRARGQA